ncbi:META domain-containing protein [Streptomyces sp. NRRL F-5126]|uniref:META domain-containing protein n=1 Tax=Streptomyces sp. NRRL F-5126 TaxID=1463857 RepID=UPI0004CAA075|nr:META domain-containing protein [Streptomyces sp. NRRL F-5126]
MQKQGIATVGIAALLALTAACGTQSGTSGTGAGTGSGTAPSADPSGSAVRTDLPLTGVRWKVDSLTVAGASPAVPAAATMEIDRDGRISLGTGCNGYSGRVRVEGDEITVVSGLNRTFVGCSMYLERYEEAIGDAFKGTLKAHVSGRAANDRELVLTSPGKRGTRVALTTRPDAPLVGTAWTVDALTGAKSSTTLPKGTEGKAHFTFEHGAVSGSLGCNSFRAPVKVSGSKVTFGRVISTKMACSPALSELEQGILKVLKGTVTAQTSHKALFLKGKDGAGLAAVAR